MLRPDEIQQALHASRVVDLEMADLHGPLGLEHLAAVVKDLQTQPQSSVNGRSEAITITLRSGTRQKLERMATTQVGGSSNHLTAADLAAAIVERFVTSAAV
ncbi:MAG TPA: hypothetical protein VE988_14625 [Gemmataceae bacterium]|nr:hypothetical protein [Gemmataceae bacterium]